MATINNACIAGLRAGMEPADAREVPPQFARNEALAAAWLDAYDGIAVAMLNQRPNVMDAPMKPERHVGDKEQTVPKKKAAAAKPQAHAKPSMMAVLDRQLAEQF